MIFPSFFGVKSAFSRQEECRTVPAVDKDSAKKVKEILSGDSADIVFTVSPVSQFVQNKAEMRYVFHPGRSHSYPVEVRTKSDMSDSGDRHSMVDMVGYNLV